MWLAEKYPVILVTHVNDARNKFADPIFQWEFPVQVFAERGYLVLSVNDGRQTVKSAEASKAYVAMEKNVSVAEEQFRNTVIPVASMEVALQSVIDRGIADH